MAKTQRRPANAKRFGRSSESSEQREVVPSSELVPLQFKMPPAFVKRFKQAALDRDMKLNQLLQTAFEHFTKASNHR